MNSALQHSRKPRVLEIGHSYVVGTNRGVVRALARDPRIDITVVSPRFFHGDFGAVSIEQEPNANLQLVSMQAHFTRSAHLFWYAKKALRELLQARQFDVVSAWQEPYVMATRGIVQALGNARSRFCFRTAQNLAKSYPPPFGSFERNVLQRSNGWIAGGELVRHTMQAKVGAPTLGRVIPLGVDTEEFRPLDASERVAELQRLELKSPVVVYLGRFVLEKGLRLLMRALDRVPPPWSLLLLGSGPLEREIRRWGARLGSRRTVKIVRLKHAEVPRALGACDVLVAPSQTTREWKEQFGRMVIEAFACGVPVISSSSGELPHVVGDAGKIVPETDEARWAEAIGTFLSSAEERSRFSEAGLARCHQRYATPVVAAQRLAFYQDLLDAPMITGA